MGTIDRELLCLLASREDIDAISTRPFQEDEIYLHKDDLVGIFIKNFGVVLEPEFVSIQRFHNIVKVAVKNGKFVHYKGYDIQTDQFIINSQPSEYRFWLELKKLPRHIYANTEVS